MLEQLVAGLAELPESFARALFVGAVIKAERDLRFVVVHGPETLGDLQDASLVVSAAHGIEVTQ